MRKFFFVAAILLSASAAHAGPALAAADQPNASSTAQPAASSSAQVSDAEAIAAKRQAVIDQQMETQKQIARQRQMAVQRQMQLHPIRTRLQFAYYKFKRQMRAF